MVQSRNGSPGAAACNLGYCATHEPGVGVRTQTIAEGAEYCDFRWILHPVASQERVEGEGEVKTIVFERTDGVFRPRG